MGLAQGTRHKPDVPARYRPPVRRRQRGRLGKSAPAGFARAREQGALPSQAPTAPAEPPKSGLSQTPRPPDRSSYEATSIVPLCPDNVEPNGSASAACAAHAPTGSHNKHHTAVDVTSSAQAADRCGNTRVCANRRLPIAFHARCTASHRQDSHRRHDQQPHKRPPTPSVGVELRCGASGRKRGPPARRPRRRVGPKRRHTDTPESTRSANTQPQRRHHAAS